MGPPGSAEAPVEVRSGIVAVVVVAMVASSAVSRGGGGFFQRDTWARSRGGSECHMGFSALLDKVVAPLLRRRTEK